MTIRNYLKIFFILIYTCFQINASTPLKETGAHTPETAEHFRVRSCLNFYYNNRKIDNENIHSNLNNVINALHSNIFPQQICNLTALHIIGIKNNFTKINFVFPLNNSSHYIFSSHIIKPYLKTSYPVFDIIDNETVTNLLKKLSITPNNNSVNYFHAEVKLCNLISNLAFWVKLFLHNNIKYTKDRSEIDIIIIQIHSYMDPCPACSQLLYQTLDFLNHRLRTFLPKTQFYITLSSSVPHYGAGNSLMDLAVDSYSYDTNAILSNSSSFYIPCKRLHAIPRLANIA